MAISDEQVCLLEREMRHLGHLLEQSDPAGRRTFPRPHIDSIRVEVRTRSSVTMPATERTPLTSETRSRRIPSRAKILGPATVRDGVWIDARATIFRGATVDNGAVTGASPAATKSIAPNAMVVGTPATPLRTLDL